MIVAHDQNFVAIERSHNRRLEVELSALKYFPVLTNSHCEHFSFDHPLILVVGACKRIDTVSNRTGSKRVALVVEIRPLPPFFSLSVEQPNAWLDLLRSSIYPTYSEESMILIVSY